MSAREWAKGLLFDAVGCGLAGWHGEETAQVLALARALGASGEASVLGGEPLSLAGATLLNAYLVTAVTVCDVYRPSHCHMTPEVVPPALAIAERDHLSGRALLTAVAAGFEVATRVALGLHYPTFRARGWHSPGVVGPFGGAAAVGKLRGLNWVQQRNAFGLAGSQAAGTFAAWGTPTVKFHQARGALSGLLAATLAEQGFLASEEILAHPDGGLLSSYSDGGQPEAVVADLGSRWELEQISLRLWPAATPLQSLLTALFDLIRDQNLRAETVEAVRVELPTSIFNAHKDFAEPRGTFEALLSPHFVTAVVLHEREAWLAQFGPDRYADERLRGFIRERVEVAPDDGLPLSACRVSARLRDGQHVERVIHAPKGDPRNPASEAEIAAKFRRCADGVLTSEATDRLAADLLNLERLSDVSTLCRLASRTGTGARV